MFYSPMEQFDLIPLMVYQSEYFNLLLQTWSSFKNSYFLPLSYELNPNIDLITDIGLLHIKTLDTSVLNELGLPHITSVLGLPILTYDELYPLSYAEYINISFISDYIIDFSFFFLTNYVVYLFICITLISLIFFLSINLSTYYTNYRSIIIGEFLWFMVY